MKRFFCLSAVVLCLLVLLPVRADADGILKEFTYDRAPFPSAHASTVVELKSGDYLSAWFGGTAEGKPDVAIWAARRTAKGWTEPVEMVREDGVPCWNPVLFYARDGRLWLYYKFGPKVTYWTAGRLYSDDDGKTWSPAEHLPAGVYGPIRAKPLVLADGTIVSGTSVESYQSWASWIERSTDDGKTWTRIGPITLPELKAITATKAEEKIKESGGGKTIGLIQPAIASLGGKHLRIYMRSTSHIGKICVADSFDNGLTWTDAHPLDLPNPNSGIDVVRLRDGRIVLLYNNTSKGRTPLDLAVSKDGERFTHFATLESEPGEFSYPAIIQGTDGNLHMTYTWNRKQIRYVVFPLKDIPAVQ